MSVTIERLGHLGDGIATGPVFVSRALPGEVVSGEIVGDRIEVPKIDRPSPDRVSAPCPHYKGCGGCMLQHASDAFVADWKVEVVRSALAARGISAPIRRVHKSPPRSRRRATFSGRRTKKGAIVGFHAAGSDAILQVPHCLLLRPALTLALPHLERIVAATGSRKGEMRMTLTETETGLDLSVHDGRPFDIALLQDLIALTTEAGFVRLSWDGEPVISHRRPVLRFGTAQVSPPPGAFLQATSDGEAALLGSIVDALKGAKGPVVDLFSGVGTFCLPLALQREVHAVESEAEMLAALDDGWRHGTGLHKVTTERRDLFRRPLTFHELSRFAAVVIDPPRAGAEAQTAELARSRVPRIAFVSCNPVTFARDAALLIDAGHALDWIDVVDQFRWSAHVELAASFSLS